MVVVVVVVAAGSNTLFLNLQLFDPWKLEVLHRLICRQLLPIEQSGRLADVMDKKLTAGKKKRTIPLHPAEILEIWECAMREPENQRTRPSSLVTGPSNPPIDPVCRRFDQTTSLKTSTAVQVEMMIPSFKPCLFPSSLSLPVLVGMIPWLPLWAASAGTSMIMVTHGPRVSHLVELFLLLLHNHGPSACHPTHSLQEKPLRSSTSYNKHTTQR